MNSSSGKEYMSTASSSAGWRAVDSAAADQFPAGLRVLVVDDDPTCLMILEKMLRTCLYEVTKCNRAEAALLMLRANKNGFDIVISDVHMPDMDGFELLEHIGLEMDLPVIMMSADNGKHVVMKGVTHGACDYLIKPVRIEALKNIWQHVVRKRKNEWDFEQSGSVEEGDRLLKQPDNADYSSSANEGNWRSSKRRRDDEDETDERDDTSTLKKPRVVWSVELHQQFVAAVNQLGIDKAVPKKILELMNIPGLTRENVASHLQKYRLYLRRLRGVSQYPGNLSNSFMSPQEAAFGPLWSLNGLDLATLQAVGLGRSAGKSGLSVPFVDQRTMEPKQLTGLNNLLSMQMAQPQARGQVINDSSLSHAPRLLSPMVQPILSNGIAAKTGIQENIRAPNYNPVLQTSSDIKGSVRFMPSYDIFNDLNQHKPRNWELQDIGMTFDALQHSNNLNSLLVDGTVRVKSETVADAAPTDLYPDHFGQEDLMTALLKQQDHCSHQTRVRF